MTNDIKLINKLIVKISQKNEKALEELFLLTKEKLYYLAYHYLLDKSKIDDVLNITYSKIYEKAAFFDKKQNGFNWIHTILKNQAFDFNRVDMKEPNISLDEDIFMACEEHCSKRMYYLKIALKNLDEEEKHIVVLKFWKLKTLAEIAQTMDIPISTVYRKYTAALDKMHTVLLDLEKGDL